MKQAAIANEPDVPPALLDDSSDPPNRLAVAVIAVMSKGLRLRVKPVEAAVGGSEPEMATTVAGNAPNRIAAKAVGVGRVVKVAGSTFGSGVEFVNSIAMKSSSPSC